jgi:hypothetical protein
MIVSNLFLALLHVPDFFLAEELRRLEKNGIIA